MGEIYIAEFKVNNNNLLHILDLGLSLGLNYMDWDQYWFYNKEQIIYSEKAIAIFKKDHSESRFVKIVYKNVDFDLLVTFNADQLIFKFYFSSNILYNEKNYYNNIISVDISTYIDLILQWLKPFQINEMNIEYSKF